MSSLSHLPKRFALILIDPQNGFINDGSWSRMFPLGQSVPILEAFDHTVLFLRSISNPQSIPVLISETGFSSRDRQIYPPIANELSTRGFPSLTRAYKPHTNLSICPGVRQWLREQNESKLDIVIGGCTITSCVRDSSIQMKRICPELDFFVVRNLCAARKDNYLRRCRTCLERYMIDASAPIEQCLTCNDTNAPEQILSPVDLAFQQMKAAGVHVVETYPLENSS